MPPWVFDILMIIFAAFLVVLNGFFVATEFALVKSRTSRIKAFVQQGRPFAKMAFWLICRLDKSLSACQLGITMASLGLGWLGEPAFSHLLRPIFDTMGITSAVIIHGISFAVAFAIITAVHLVLGEQAPKIFAIRKPERVLLACALPMKLFYILLLPFLISLNYVTALLLRKLGIEGVEGHDSVMSEEEIRGMLSEAHLYGELTRSEHRLLNAVFEFDDTICRHIMLPRNDVVFFDVNQSLSDCFELTRKTKHSRYPLCKGSLDQVLGVIHIKDLIGLASEENLDWHNLARPPHQVPETMPISRLLRHFQSSHHHLAFVIDEYGTIVGVVTLEDVIERIVGEVKDEFDMEVSDIVQETKTQFIVHGSVPISELNSRLKLELQAQEVDTLSGLLTMKTGRILQVGDLVTLEEAEAKVLDVKNGRAQKIRIILEHPEATIETTDTTSK